MRWTHSNQVEITKWVLKYRWPLMLTLGLFAFSFEFLEHIFSHHRFDAHFVREIIIFALLVPFLGGYILSLLLNTEADRLRVANQLNLEHWLNLQMSRACSWQALSEILTTFPQQVAPFTSTCLQLYDPESVKFKTVASWRKSMSSEPVHPSALTPDENRHCQRCHPQLDLPKLHPCDLSKPENEYQRYCLPLIHGEVSIALLQLYLPYNENLSNEQQELFNNLAPSMAFAVDSWQPYGSGIIRAVATEQERKRLARYLHDTLGQNLGYLCLKLDQLKGDNVVEELAAVRRELAQMHSVANQAYEQIRHTLTSLHSEPVSDIETALVDELNSLADRSQLKTVFSHKGEKVTLPNYVLSNISGIFHEALINVEKHAEANKVELTLEWTPTELNISLRDDGQGFIPIKSKSNGHLGLSIMNERAEVIGGSLTLNSSDDMGTEIKLNLPLSTHSVPVQLQTH